MSVIKVNFKVPFQVTLDDAKNLLGTIACLQFHELAIAGDCMQFYI